MQQPRATYVFEGTITAEQPLATCSAALKEAEKARRGDKFGPTPVPYIQTELGRRLMFPATGIRGKMRRTLRDVLRDALIKRTGEEKPLTLRQHYMLTLGGVKGSEEVDRASVAHQALWRDKNPLLSLFGAGDAGDLGFMTGRLSVGNAICVDACDPSVFSGARADDLYRDRQQLEFLGDGEIAALIAMSKGNRDRSITQAKLKKAEAALKKLAKSGTDLSGVEKLQAEVAELKAELDQIKEASDEDISVSAGMPLAGYEAIPVGSKLNHRMILSNANLVELGALLASIEQMSLSPLLGGHIAAGCGLVSMSWEVFSVRAGEGKRSIGSVSFEPFAGVLTMQGPDAGDLAAAKNAFSSFLAGDVFDLSVPVV
jgi:CRISPR/Cas system CSM-associated protein Csm3 (group 7 of RAMP superfamily)